MATKRKGPGLIQLTMMALAAVAVAQELRKPAEDRTWHGTVAGFVPYDFRMPTLERLKQRLWDPEGSLIGPHVFGVGWTVNVGRATALVREQIG
ncbi:MAG TPA: hypothetical protein PKB06_06500 [Actinotalea sp.]|nr:hypothetical protein [Actinotalea sp.]